MMTRGYLRAAVVTAGVVIGTQVWAGEGWVKDSINGCKMWTDDVEVGKVFSWSGSCVDGKASGNGVLVVFGDGEVLVRYRGTMKAGKADGVGLVEFKTDQGYVKYLGEVKNSALNGQGVLERPDGARYAGSFVDDEPDGLGSYHAKNGATYHGEFKAGKPHGRGSDRRPTVKNTLVCMQTVCAQVKGPRNSPTGTATRANSRTANRMVRAVCGLKTALCS